MQLVLPSLYLPLDIPEDMRTARLTSSEKHRIVRGLVALGGILRRIADIGGNNGYIW